MSGKIPFMKYSEKINPAMALRFISGAFYKSLHDADAPGVRLGTSMATASGSRTGVIR